MVYEGYCSCYSSCCHRSSTAQASIGSMRSRRPWYFSHPTTPATSRERNCLWMAASHKCRPFTAEGMASRIVPPPRTSPCHQPGICRQEYSERKRLFMRQLQLIAYGEPSV